MPESALQNALKKFEATEANIAKIERLWDKAESLIPTGICFSDDPEYEDLRRSIEAIAQHLPKIDGWKPDISPLELDVIAENRFEAEELGEPGVIVAMERAISEPGRLIREYRFRFTQKRRALVRDRIVDLEQMIEDAIGRINLCLTDGVESNRSADGKDWQQLRDYVAELDVLLGSMKRPPRWSDLRRHLGFALVGDFRDIKKHDWPSVKAGLQHLLYAEDEPIPVDVEDIGQIASSKPKGAVATKLNWDRLTEDDFERLVFVLISNEKGYENPEWLMKTKAPDRGRDLSVTRVSADSLSGTRRERVIIQCRHWLEKSISVADIATLKEQAKLWDKPRVDVLVLATSGRFSADAVALTESHNASDTAMKIEMWPESHLERLLAARPPLIAEFGLR